MANPCFCCSCLNIKVQLQSLSHWGFLVDFGTTPTVFVSATTRRDGLVGRNRLDPGHFFLQAWLLIWWKRKRFVLRNVKAEEWNFKLIPNLSTFETSSQGFWLRESREIIRGILLFILSKFEPYCCLYCRIWWKSETIRLLFMDKRTWRKNFTGIEVIFKILDQEDVEAHEKSREVSNRRVGS